MAKFFKKMKDGGAESTVTGYWLIEWKKVFSIVLLKFEGKSREAFHEHAFNCINWLIKGRLAESTLLNADKYGTNLRGNRWLDASWKPFVVRRKDFHKVDSLGTSWVLSFRGPWHDTWKEYVNGDQRTLTHGRVLV